MTRNRFPTPWDSDLENWDRSEISELLSHPGMSEDCATPKLGVAPVIHRFVDVFVDRQPIPFPEIETAINRLQADVDPAGNPGCNIHLENCLRRWQVRQPLIASVITYEQAWHWLGSTLGELSESICLTPGEQLEVQVYTWDRTKISHDLQSTDLVDKRAETSLTTHASAQVVNRMEHQQQWQLGANVGFSYGVTAGIEANLSDSITDSVERRREQRQDQTRKTAQQIRSERQLKISTTREAGFEERSKRTLTNENPSRTVTYNFYETVSHYRVELAMAESQTAIAIPNLLPKITPAWVTCHEGLLRNYLLDPTQESGLEAARLLMILRKQSPIAETARQLCDAFRDPMVNPGAPIYPGGPPRARIAGEETWEEHPLLSLFNTLYFQAANMSRPVPSLSIANYPFFGLYTRSNADNLTYAYVDSFLDSVARAPTSVGLGVAMGLMLSWYKPVDGACYELTDEMESVLGSAHAAFIHGMRKTSNSPETDDSPLSEGEETEPTDETSTSAPAAEDYQLETETQALFESLKCHLEQNLLHYLRPIWLAEDPAIRMRRHARELELDLSGFLDLVKQPLIGFHLNCCIYPFEPVDAKKLVPIMLNNATRARSIIQNDLKRSALTRFEKATPQLLQQVTSDASQQVAVCENKQQIVETENLPRVLELTGERLAALRQEVAKGDGWKKYLTSAENKLDDSLESCAYAWDKAAKALRQVSDDGRFTAIAEAQMTADNPPEFITTEDFKPMVISLPDGGYHCEPVVGHCSAAEELRLQKLQADLQTEIAVAKQRQAEADRQRKRVDELAANELNDPVTPSINVQLSRED